MSTGIRYRFAIGGDGAPLEIGDLDPESRSARGPFTCFGCQGLLIARLGKQVAWHFAHASQTGCVPETQLHQLGKRLFYETYRRCLERGEPYNLVYYGRTACTRSKMLGELQCTVDEKRALDLTQYYDRVEVEGRVGSFVADVLLSSSHTPHVLLVEIAVSHPCDAEKISDGKRIVEINASSEQDVQFLLQPTLDATSRQIKTYNFDTRLQERDSCGGQCDREVNVFSVYRSGKCILTHTTAAKAAVEPKDSVIYQVVRSDAMEVALVSAWTFRDQVFKAYSRGVDIKNCLMCRYQGTSDYGGRIFCRTKREHLPTNSAAECDRYRPRLTRAEAVREQREIDAGLARHHDWHKEVRLR